VSDADVTAATFFDLFSDGRVSVDDVDDFVAAWHESGDGETRPLSEYLGMTKEEYGLWVADHRLLPSMVDARRGGQSLRAQVADYYNKLREANLWDDRAAIHVLSYWVADWAAEHPAH
jgi:hypothetical protein